MRLYISSSIHKFLIFIGDLVAGVRMELPQILVNLKLYREAMGENAVKICRSAEQVYKETGVLIGLAPNTLDAVSVARNTDIPIYLQHLDPVEFGAHTGSLTAMMIKDYGLSGSLINHSERKVPLYHLSKVIGDLKSLGLASVACAQTPVEALAVAALKPSAVAVEPPELIGTGISVSKAKPEVISSSVKPIGRFFPEVKVFCGAGITTGEDVRKAVELGAKGILVASAVAKSNDPKRKLMELAEPFKSVLT